MEVQTNILESFEQILINNKNWLYLFICFIIASCKPVYKHDIKTYPKIIVEKKLFSSYDNIKWNYYVLVGDRKAKLKTFADYKLSTMDSLCISYDIEDRIELIGDSLLRYVVDNYHIKGYEPKIYCECHDFNSVPELFLINLKGELIEAGYGNVKPFRGYDLEKYYNFSTKVQNFPNILRKYKDQLNPWLKIEAQRRGIID